MQSTAKVVIIGGGSLGVNLMYHLTKEGWNDVLLIEKGELTSGSTWHAAGLCPNFNGNHSLSKIHEYSIKLYDEIIPRKTGLASTFHRTGSLRVGYTELEEQWFRNVISRSHNVGCEMRFISRDEAREINPLMNFDRARCILYTPNDGHIDPSSIVMPLGQLARENGAKVSRFNRVIDINLLTSGEYQVITEKGTVLAEHVVNAAGCFAPEVGKMLGIHIPIVNLEHQYLVTDDHPEIAKLAKELPVTRDSWASSYIRQEGNGFLIGPYETFGAKPWALSGMDWDFDRGLFAGDLVRIMPFLERCMELVPGFSEVGVKTIINGAITHTPDDNFLVGPAKGLRNFWNLCGASIGIAQGGIGKYLAQWMVHGQCEINMGSLDSRRFDSWANKQYCTVKAIESYEHMYACAAPNENRPHARPSRVTPLFSTLQQQGAVHNVVAGFEKPAWFSDSRLRVETPSWTHSDAHQSVANECAAVENHCGIMDLSAVAKFVIKGADAAEFLNLLSANKLPAVDGRISLSLFHAENGGIMAEQTISRINENHFILMGAIGSQVKDYQWLEWHSENFAVEIEDISEQWGGLLLTGPKAREILQQHCPDEDLSNSGFPWLSCKTIPLDSAEVFAMRVSYVGELGWELHMPTWQVLSIYESLCKTGTPLGLKNFGSYAMNSMRLEKKYPAYSSEFTEEISAIEAGMQRFVDTSRDFIGAANIRARQQKPLESVLAYLVFDDDIKAECFGNEAVWLNDQLIGLITSGGYGHRIGKSLAFAYIAPQHHISETQVVVETSVGKRNAHIEMKAAYDATNKKLRS